MKEGTAVLPGVKKEDWAKFAPFKGETVGKTTQEAIIKGAADGISAEIIGRWEILKAEIRGKRRGWSDFNRWRQFIFGTRPSKAEIRGF